MAANWTITQHQSAKNEIGQLVRTWRSQLDPPGVLENILAKIESYKAKSGDDHYHYCFVYCVHALLHHENYGGLSAQSVSDIFALAEGILTAAGIEPRKSRLASLHCDIHVIRSQIFRKHGDHWSAAWSQLQAIRSCGTESDTNEAFQNFVMGNRLVRMGLFRQGNMFHQAALNSGSEKRLSPAQRQNIFLCQVTQKRLCGDVLGAEQMLASVNAIENDTRDAATAAAFLTDLQWERFCCHAQKHHEIQSMIAATRRGEPMYQAGYIAEQVLWGMCLPTREALQAIAKIESHIRNRTLRIRALGVFYEVTAAIQFAYDHTVPMDTRLRRLTEALRSVPELVTIDKEILAWLAAARCLVRLRNPQFASLCLGKYESLSLIVTEGTSNDCLGLAQDLVTATWHQVPTAYEKGG
jgi:hypothetical protein